MDLSAVDPAMALLATRVIATAIVVVTIALLAERVGPFLGAMVASLPIFTGPSVLFVAIDHGPHYVEASSLGSLAVCAVSAIFAIVYCWLAQRHGLLVCLGGALAVWVAAVATIRLHHWTLIDALALNAVVYGLTLPLAQRYTGARPAGMPPRRWWHLALRAAAVAVAVASVASLSHRLAPQMIGFLSVLPIIFSSVVLVLHPRIGGPPTAALMAHALSGLVGMVIALAVLHLTVVRLGSPTALTLALAITVAWNGLLILIRARRTRRS